MVTRYSSGSSPLTYMNDNKGTVVLDRPYGVHRTMDFTLELQLAIFHCFYGYLVSILCSVLLSLSGDCYSLEMQRLSTTKVPARFDKPCSHVSFLALFLVKAFCMNGSKVSALCTGAKNILVAVFAEVIGSWAHKTVDQPTLSQENISFA